MNLIYKSILFIVLSTYIFAADINDIDYHNFLTSVKVDLNGDGKKENISIEYINSLSYLPSEDNFQLMVDDKLKKGSLAEGSPDGFVIVDIDKSDKYKEIAVHAPGECDDDEFLLYSYDGKDLKNMGKSYQWPIFYGNGIVLVDERVDFWSMREKYILEKKTKTLKLVPQEFYYVGITGKTTKSFPLYRTKKRKYIVANLKPHSEILILLCEPSLDIEDYAYLVKSITGLVGWTTHKELWDNHVEGLPYGD